MKIYKKQSSHAYTQTFTVFNDHTAHELFPLVMKFQNSDVVLNLVTRYSAAYVIIGATSDFIKTAGLTDFMGLQ